MGQRTPLPVAVYSQNRTRVGYTGVVDLVSRDGEKATLRLPGRRKSADGTIAGGWTEADKLKERRFYQLLSAGWKVNSTAMVDASDDDATDPGKQQSPEASAAEDKPSSNPEQNESEGVDEVAEATSLSSEDVHGGNEATKDIADSPNAADNGINPDNKGADEGIGGREGRGQQGEGGKHYSGRGSRGGRGQKQLEQKVQRRQKLQRQQAAEQWRKSAGIGTFSPQALRVDSAIAESAERSAHVLPRIEGTSQQKTF